LPAFVQNAGAGKNDEIPGLVQDMHLQEATLEEVFFGISD
jgi:hypothetical protein